MSKIKFNEKVVPGDGNCLFHSIGCSVNLVQNQIRDIVSKYILKNYKKKLNGLSLEEWIKMETDMTVEGYSRYILKNGEWGGNMELYVCSQVFKINLFILKKNLNKYKIISSYVFDNDAKNVFLVYNGVHYNYLKVIENKSDIKT